MEFSFIKVSIKFQLRKVVKTVLLSFLGLEEVGHSDGAKLIGGKAKSFLKIYFKNKKC